MLTDAATADSKTQNAAAVAITTMKPPPPDEGMELRSRRRFFGSLVSASMSTGRFLARLGVIRGDHITTRKLSRIGVGLGHSEEIPGIRYLKTRIGGVKVRVYLPVTKAPLRSSLTIYFHGGGWVLSSARCYHRFTAVFARDTQSVVISVDYRLAPENPFPAGLDDCLAVTQAVLNGDFEPTLFFPHSVDLSRVVLAGDSAGGNLACATALDLIRLSDFRLFALMLVCPSLQCVTLNFPSYRQHGRTHFQPIGLDYFVPHYAGVRYVGRSLMEALWRGTHLTKEDRVSLSRTVTLGSLYSASSPSMAAATSNSSNSDLIDEMTTGYYGEGQLMSLQTTTTAGVIEQLSIGRDSATSSSAVVVVKENGGKKFYLEDDDSLPNGGGGVNGSLVETGSGGSCAVSPSTIGDFHDEELSPVVVKAITDLARNRRAWPLLALDEELKHLPQTFLQICECDPLRSENELFCERMKRAGAVSLEVTLLEKAGHVESLLAERLPSKVAILGYRQMVDFVIKCRDFDRNHANSPKQQQPHLFDQVTEYFE